MHYDSITALGIIGLLIFLFLYIVFSVLRDAIYFFLIHYFGLVNLFILKEEQQNILNELNKINYYKNLSVVGKNYFYHRVIVFMINKHFFGDGIKLSDEVKTYISASAVQLTFHIRGFYIEHIQLIRVFPQAVWSQMAQHDVKGLTTGGGVMWLSWPDIKKGFDFPDDGINLGIHEMAHAFKFTLRCDHSSSNRICSSIRNWSNAAKSSFLKLQEGDTSFFRSYGATNMEEYWAVNVECFFEKPEEFVQLYPEIYILLCKVFNQNPLNASNDYQLRNK
ncbi:hypothetical protein LBMAG27_19260 [Bacteroidota bacterium]|nr:hypothetical protein LBMAG27_19260 [Bacteroidota bacterium]